MKMISKDNELKHFGILGMKWGVRRKSASNVSAGPGKRPSKPGPKLMDELRTASTYSNSVYNRANRESIRNEKDPRTRLRRTFIYQNARDLQDTNRRAAKILAQDKKIRDLTTKYKNEYMSGKSTTDRIIAKITLADSRYARSKMSG